MSDPDVWEHVFAGGGIAASLLALRLARDGAGPLLVIDPTPDDRRTLVYWADRPTDLDAFAEHDWTTLRLADASGAFDRPLGGYRYRLVRAEVILAAARRAVEAGGGRLVRGRVTAIEDGPGTAVVHAAGARYRARWVYDSRPPEEKAPGLVQWILGAWVETDHDAFEPDVATLMDFRAPQGSGAVRFFHLMPTSARRALVHAVTFGEDGLTARDLDGYLALVLGPRGWRITEHEGGSTEMTARPFRRRTGTRVLAVGVAGGRLKGSTGYALVRIADDAARVAASLRRVGHPFELPADPELPRWLDAVLLDLVRARGPDTIPVFMAMFRDNPVQRALRFLDEEAAAGELARLVGTLPGKAAFGSAGLRVVVGDAVAAWRFWALAAGVIGGPSLAFVASAPADAEAAGPAMLAFLLAPALVANGLAWGLPRLPGRPGWSAVGLAVVLGAAIAAIGAAGGIAGGALVVGGDADGRAALDGALTGALTSTLEELGWAAGGVVVARASLGPRLGVLGLGLVWAAWHLVIAALAPPEIALAMFGTAEPLGAARVGLFVAGCVAYRVVLTALRDRTDSVWPAVAAHATGNVLLGGALGSGWARLDPDGPWLWFPGPTGLPFLAAAVTVAWLGRSVRDGLISRRW